MNGTKQVYWPISCLNCGWIPYPYNGLLGFSKCPQMHTEYSDPDFKCPKDGKVFIAPTDLNAKQPFELVESEMSIKEFESLVDEAIRQEKERQNVV